VLFAFRKIKRSKLARSSYAKVLASYYVRRFLDAQPETLPGLRNRAMIPLGYELLTRRSELVALRTEDVQLRAYGTLKVVIRRNKSDQFGEGRTAFSSRETAGTVMVWINIGKIKCQAFFSPVYKGKALDRSQSDMTVRRLVKETAGRAGFSEELAAQFSGHSFRVGAAQDLLRLGYDGIAIMRAGGWKSTQTVLRYLREAEHNVWIKKQRPTL